MTKSGKYIPVIILISIIFVLIYIIYNNTNTIDLLNNRISKLESDVQQLAVEILEKTNTINNQSNTISSQQQTIKANEQKIEIQRVQIDNLNTLVKSLESQLGETKANLQETSRLLDIAQDYESRVEQGVYLSEAYLLLGDYDKTVDLVKGITNVGAPANDQEIWGRTKAIFEWLGNNYQYCSDKGFCVGNSCTQIQFFSPDELLYYGSQDVLCGDCDDQAQLFAGMMYASGVPHDKVAVACGNVPEGGHCWNIVYVNSTWYRIDPVCSDPAKYLNFFGRQIQVSGKVFPSNYRSISCFTSYNLTSWYNPEGFHYV